MTAQEQAEIIQRRERALFKTERTLFTTSTANRKCINNISISKPTILEIGLESNRVQRTPRMATQRLRKEC